MKTIDWNIGMVTGVLKGIRLTQALSLPQVKAINDAIESIEDIERWTKEAITVMNSWDRVKEATEKHPDIVIGELVSAAAYRFIKRDADNQRKPFSINTREKIPPNSV